MQEWIIQIMNQFGYFGIALLIAIENIFPPIPSEVILTFGGFMTTHSELKIWGVVLVATIGSIVGALVLYGIGRLLTPQRLGKIIDKWGHILRVKKEDIQKAEGWFNKRGNLTVFFCRFIPIIRSLISIPAGMSHMNMGKFLIYTTLGTSIWNIVLVCLGSFAGENWEVIVGYINTYSHIVLLILAVIAVILIIWFVKKRINRKKREETQKNENK
ncbi:MAG: DedA family protein [Oscillospiraceae bacterium]